MQRCMYIFSFTSPSVLVEEPALIESVTFPDGSVSARLPFHNHLTSFVTIIYVPTYLPI